MTFLDSFSASLQKLGLDAPGLKIAVAVSGGGDSLALTLLMQEWAEKYGGNVHAFTVDHGLRPNSRAEAEELQAKLKKRGIRHDILLWQGDKPLTHIQERAREARYALLLEACKKEGISTLAVAHNLEDQIETFWMRLAKGSGIDGLAAMAPSRIVEGIRIVRPLLGFSRADLRQVCRDFGEEWAEDPSNANEQFLRVKLRQFEELLASEGMTPQRLAQTLQKFEEARDALQVFAETAAAQVLAFHEAGFARLKISAWKELPAEIQRRVLSVAIMSIAPGGYAPGFEALEQACAEINAEQFAGRTLSGCDLSPAKGDEVIICREAAAALRMPLANGLVWDGFWVSWHRSESPGFGGIEVGILGEEGLSVLRQNGDPKSPLFARLESLPFKVRKVLPALWKGQNLMAVPYLNWVASEAPAGVAEVAVSFSRTGSENAPRRVKIV